MTKNKTVVSTTSPGEPQPPAMVTTVPVSALSQQLEQVSLDKKQQPHHSSSSASSSPQKRPSSKRKSKSDFSGTGSGNDLTQPQPKPKRSPKGNKVNGVKQQFSTPSKPTSIPNGHHYPAVAPAAPTTAQDSAAAHYAGPTFHSSPAPSSLPMPSFFASKTTKPVALQNGSDLDSPPQNQSTPIKPLRSSVNGHQAFGDQDDSSPLALFFKADREEKNRLRNKHSADSNNGVDGIFGSPTQRPTSAGGIPDYASNLRSESPLLWNDSPKKGNGRFDLRSRSLYNNDG